MSIGGFWVDYFSWGGRGFDRVDIWRGFLVYIYVCS